MITDRASFIATDTLYVYMNNLWSVRFSATSLPACTTVAGCCAYQWQADNDTISFCFLNWFCFICFSTYILLLLNKKPRFAGGASIIVILFIQLISSITCPALGVDRSLVKPIFHFNSYYYV